VANAGTKDVFPFFAYSSDPSVFGAVQFCVGKRTSYHHSNQGDVQGFYWGEHRQVKRGECSPKYAPLFKFWAFESEQPGTVPHYVGTLSDSVSPAGASQDWMTNYKYGKRYAISRKPLSAKWTPAFTFWAYPDSTTPPSPSPCPSLLPLRCPLFRRSPPPPRHTATPNLRYALCVSQTIRAKTPRLCVMRTRSA
jgi:hypothetical protein